MIWPDPDTVCKVPSKDKEIIVKVVSVHDGDTFTVLLPIGSEFLKIGIRLLGVDAPELKSSNPQECQAARIVCDKLAALIDQQEIKVICKRWDKYGGRLLAEAWLPTGQSLAEYLLENGFAKSYHGEKKQGWTDAELLRIYK